MTAATLSPTTLYAADFVPAPRHGMAAPNEVTRGFLSVAYCVVGTMGLLTPQMLEQRTGTSTLPIHYESRLQRAGAIESATHPLEPSAAEDLELVRQVFKPTMLELANLFGVSRQALYGWQAGAQPAQEAASRLAALARAAAVFSQAGVAVDARTLRRKLTGGRTLLDAIASGQAAEPLAQSLVDTLQREAAQRLKVQTHLASRKRNSAQPGDYGAPGLVEGA